MWARIMSVRAKTVTLTNRNMVADNLISDINRLAHENSAEANADIQKELSNLFSLHVPDEIPEYLRHSFLDTLLLTNCWPASNAKPIGIKDADTTKDQLIDLIFRSDVPDNTKINASLQAFCKRTFLGSIFHEPRWFTSPSVDAGRLRQLAGQLEAWITAHGNEHVVIAESTQNALIAEARRDSSFIYGLQAFPHIYSMVRGFLPRQEQRTSLFGLRELLPAFLAHSSNAAEQSARRDESEDVNFSPQPM